MSESITIVNPTDEQPIAEVALLGVDGADEAVARSVEAGPAWRAVAPRCLSTAPA